MKIRKVISGGQTGADRAALDAAIACGVPHGGWCPLGRLAEDGEFPTVYQLTEMDSPEYPERTRANVEAADITLIFSHGPLSGGSLLTMEFAEELNKPCLHVDLLKGFHGLEILQSAFPESEDVVLNIAGPRASGDPLIYDAVYQAVISLLAGYYRS